MAASSGGAEQPRSRARGEPEQGAEGLPEGAGQQSEAAARPARERGAEGGPGGANSDAREALSQRPARVHQPA